MFLYRCMCLSLFVLLQFTFVYFIADDSLQKGLYCSGEIDSEENKFNSLFLFEY
jgi:hypothetical protein